MDIAEITSMTDYRAILLLGPTASEKTPVGELLALRGLSGRRCVHFDFGAQLRRIVERNEPDTVVSREDVDFLRDVLLSGALLEDEHFPIAGRILRSFLSASTVDRQTIVLLNGLPRHVGQAAAVDATVDVVSVVALHCTSETVRCRVERDTGGDRADRTDDDTGAIENKLEIYRRRTMPLIEYYSKRGVPVESFDVAADMTPEAVYERVEAALDPVVHSLFPDREARRTPD